MKSRRWLIPTFILGTLIVDSVVVPLTVIHYPTFQHYGDLGEYCATSCPHEIGSALLAFANGQIILFALWAGIERWFAPWRWLSLGLISFLWTIFFFHIRYAFLFAEKHFACFFLLGSILLLGVWCLRIVGLRWENIQFIGTADQGSRYGRLQYPLRLILEWMTAFAIVLACWQTASGYELAYAIRYELDYELVFFVLLQVVISILLLWLMLVNGQKRLYILFLGFLMFAGINLYNGNWHIKIRFGYIYDVHFFRFLVLYLFGSLCIIRLEGYRFVWNNHNQTNAPQLNQPDK